MQFSLLKNFRKWPKYFENHLVKEITLIKLFCLIFILIEKLGLF